MRTRVGRKVSDFSRGAITDEIMRYADNDYLWHMHVTGVDLMPHQQVVASVIDEHHTILQVWSRRLGKSFSIAAKLLKEAATKPRSEINIHAPALEQSKRDLKYMTDMVINSPILMQFVEQKLGEGLGKEHIEFINGSVIQAKGQASSVDGLGATHQWWEEVDDMELNTLFERIYPTGSMIKPGYNYGKKGQCTRIATGTIKGMGNIYNFENPRDARTQLAFTVLPKYTGWHGVQWGIIPENDLLIARDVLMTPDQFARAYLCLYTESMTFFPTKLISKSYSAFAKLVDIPEYQKEHNSKIYKAEGIVTVGIDAGGQGTGNHPSKWAISFVEDMGSGQVRWIYSEEFSATENIGTVISRTCDLLNFFRPIRGYGDAFDTSFLYQLNKVAYESKITKINVDLFENRAGENGWNQWFICPIRFNGPNKHLFYTNLRLMFYQYKIKFPYIVRNDSRYDALSKIVNQLENIKKEDGSLAKGYEKYGMIRPAIGDDYVDSLALATYANGEFHKTVRPIGMAIETSGFRQFSNLNIIDKTNFIQRIGFEEQAHKPKTYKDFLRDDD